MYRDRLEEDVRNWYYSNTLNESTSDSGGGRGSYVGPLQPGVRIFKKNDMQPFNIPVSKYDDAMLEYDSYDGTMDEPKKVINKLEKVAKRISKKIEKNPYLTFSDDDGNNINQYPDKKKTIVPIVREWVEITEDTVMEDLGVWFGTKKKPKGSKQPKGPWVNICKKVDGKHPPCGRASAKDSAYPKCRAAGVAGKMTDAQKKAACQQKRRAEKTHPKLGTGNSPKMVSYKPKKKKINESFKEILRRVISEELNK